MGTVFLICVYLDEGRTVECGPYLTLREASEVLSEWIPCTLRALGLQSKTYKAEIQEVMPGINTWELIDVKISATETFRLEEFNESLAG